jgi:hypothetical protein
MSNSQPGRLAFFSLIVVVLVSLVGALVMVCYAAAMH